MSLLTYLIALPLGVYCIAGCFALLDFTDKGRALLVITNRLLLTVLVLLVVGVAQWRWLVAGYLTVALAHLASFILSRWGVYSERWISKRIE